MYLFLIPLLIGFCFHLASAFTTAWSQQFGPRVGRLLTGLLRDVLGLPVWAVGFILACSTSAARLLPTAPGLEIIGWTLITLGAAIILAALAHLRTAAFAPATCDSLQESGLYALIRHPIHVGCLLEFGGLFILRPTRAVGVACVLGLAWVLLQTAFEEYDLEQRMPEYHEYRQRVPAFLPHLKIKR